MSSSAARIMGICIGRESVRVHSVTRLLSCTRVRLRWRGFIEICIHPTVDAWEHYKVKRKCFFKIKKNGIRFFSRDKKWMGPKKI